MADSGRTSSRFIRYSIESYAAIPLLIGLKEKAMRIIKNLLRSDRIIVSIASNKI